MAYSGAYANYPRDLSEPEGQLTIERLKDYALSIGFAVKPHFEESGNDRWLPDRAMVAPVTVYPSLFPESCYREALAIQQDYNTLYANIACDVKWLEEIVPKYVM
jgi:hypothetical protein